MPSTPRPWVGPPASSTSAGWALLPIRAFIGFTFTFAGLQKLANPGFFDATNPTSFQAQLKEAAHSSPMHALVGPLQHIAVPLGVILALGELAAGIGTLLGLWARIAAIGGMVLSLSLFLTVSFHASPYYTGSDIVFFFAWIPLLVAGSGGVLSVDAFLAARTRSRAASPSSPTSADRHELDRRAFALKAIALGTAGALGIVLAGLAAGVGRLVGHSSDADRLRCARSPGTTPVPRRPSPGPPRPPRRAGGCSPPTRWRWADRPPSTIRRPGIRPSSSSPAAGSFAAFDAICPHEGCTVAYAAPDKLFICPCHGSGFNGETGALVQGPGHPGAHPHLHCRRTRRRPVRRLTTPGCRRRRLPRVALADP